MPYGDWASKAGGYVGDKLYGDKGREWGQKVGDAYWRAQTGAWTGGWSEMDGGDNPHGQNGLGIGAGPGEVAYHQTPGLQQGTALQGDYDQSGPGAAERQWAASQGAYNTPGAGMQWWQGNQGQFAKPGAAETYQAQWRDPSGSLSANMGGYYDRARERSVADIDKAFAGRGMYGSSAATGAIGQAVTDLSAQQARDEANYGLQRSAEQRAWSGLGGDLARSAQDSQLARLLGAGNTAFAAGNEQLNQQNSAMNAATAAQEARRGRTNDMFAQVSAPGQMLFGMQGQYYPQMLGMDAALMDSSVLMGTGLAQDMVNQDHYATEKDRADAEMAGQVFGKLFGLGV